MKYHLLGDIEVSEICLGTMTFGEQNSEAEAHSALDYAVGRGVNFIDAAEMYPVPPRAETQGRTEEYLGNWLKKRRRDELVIATKAAGPARGFSWIRGGPRALDRENIFAACEGSLRRLRTDYIDLYQIHWPDRNVPMFGGRFYDPAQERETIPILEQLRALSELVKSGKVRMIGLSNETPWGVMEFLSLSAKFDLPRVVSIQNAYNLLNRTFEQGLSEISQREKVGLLAYSPLGFGLLSGKYLKDPAAKGRRTQFPGFAQRYAKTNVEEAVAAYAGLAAEAGLTPAAMALAFVRSKSFTTSTIIGATTLEQLAENLNSAEIELPADLLRKIDAIHERFPNPAP